MPNNMWNDNVMGNILSMSRGEELAFASNRSGGHLQGLLARNSVLAMTSPSSREKMQWPTGKTKSAGDIRRTHLRFTPSNSSPQITLIRSKKRSSWSSKKEAASSLRASQPATSLKNETWDVLTTNPYPDGTAPCKVAKQVSGGSMNSSGPVCSQYLQSRSKKPLKSSLVSGATPKSMVSKRVNFSFADTEINYSVFEEDIRNSWLDIDVSSAIEAAENESSGMIVIFGPYLAASAVDMCRNGKGYMVRIQKSRLINEILGQRTRLRQAVFEEQARQKREGVVDAKAMKAVASAQSKWGVEVAQSSWWLRQN